mmetsp:Transcript_47678/g.126414  ORF Transcript_47678/g.126414 Transcript_47678/m.126414 type:complete len:84 (-) Transcript_47678:159-410(-)
MELLDLSFNRLHDCDAFAPLLHALAAMTALQHLDADDWGPFSAKMQDRIRKARPGLRVRWPAVPAPAAAPASLVGAICSKYFP